MLDVNYSTVIAPVFFPVHKAVRLTTSLHTFWLKGGRGSTKSSFIALQIVIGIVEDPEANAVIFRKVGDTIRRSVLPQIEWALDTLKVRDKFTITVSPAEVVYNPTGQKIIFLGLDDPQKLKSLKIKKGYFKFRWFEELSEFNGMAEIRSVRQSVQRGGKRFIEFASYNPPNDPQAWVNSEVEKVVAGRMVVHANYTDVPPEWLGEQFITAAEELQADDLLAYLHEYMGEAVGKSEAKIFANKCVVQEFTPQEHWLGPYYGADWGFATDPNTLVKCWLEPINDKFKLYIEYAEFGYGTELDDIPDMWDMVPGSRTHEVEADSARPETISHVKGKGFRVKSVEKWSGSVEDGITVIQSFIQIVIHTRCKEMAQEARLYSYKVDRLTQQVLPVIVDKFNHGWDAVRYALSKYIKRKGKSRFSR